MSGQSNHFDGSCHAQERLANPQTQLTVSQAYALWAETYDNAANPMLALEERCLEPLLPSLADKTVLDLGCGTGRLLNRLSSSSAGWYLGVDTSAAMLARAAGKLRTHGHLLRADCVQLPLRSEIADVVICSFLLGYVPAQELAAEIARVSRGPAELFVSEFHPDSRSLGWKRSFRACDQVIELPTTQCSLQDLEHAFRPHGFDLVRTVEPGFDEPEREIFLANKKGHVFETSRGTPAIFICHFRRRTRVA
jgi:ubiquinone/menaquinone biosynthesis C-methylase UbiE